MSSQRSNQRSEAVKRKSARGDRAFDPAVPTLGQGIDTYTRLGFNVYPGGAHPGKGTHNAIAFHEEDYLELVSVSDRDEYLAARAAAGGTGPSLLDFLSGGGGLRYVVVQSD